MRLSGWHEAAGRIGRLGRAPPARAAPLRLQGVGLETPTGAAPHRGRRHFACVMASRPSAERGGIGMDLGLKGRVALVTAASKGMGRACALGLAAEGARVAMCARNEGDLKTAVDEVKAATKAEVLGVAADVTKP